MISDNPFIPEYPAGRFFAGRERQLRQLAELLDSLTRGMSSNLCVVGRGGEGKTTYLEKIMEEAKGRSLIATKCGLDVAKAAETDVDTILQSLLRDIEISTGQKHLEDDWKSGEKSSFRAPHYKEIRSDQLQIDFQRILELLSGGNFKGCVVCIDEGQRMHPIALTTLKNALQPLKRGYMIVLSLLNDEAQKDNKERGGEILDDLAVSSGDPGASRFFKYNFTSLGPFDSQAEAEDCVRKRLEDNVVIFTEDVIAQIPRIMGRNPAGIIALSRGVYQRAKESTGKTADKVALREAFLENYRTEVTDAIRFCQQLPSDDKSIYRAALTFENRFSLMQIAKHLLADSKEFPSDQLVESIKAAIERLLNAGLCKKDGEKEYCFSKSAQAYALLLALEQR